MKAAAGFVGTMGPLALGVLLAACQSQTPASRPTGGEPDNRDAIRMMQAVNAEAQRCWRGDRSFRAYKVIPELDTRYGKPRILIVRADAPQGLPQYVIEAAGRPARMETYGPLASQEIGNRMQSDAARWASGGKGCAA